MMSQLLSIESIGTIKTRKLSLTPVVLLLLIALSNNDLIINVESQRGAQSCHLRELDLCATTALSFLQNPNGLPVTEGEMDKQCDLLKEAQECLDNFTEKCLTATNAALGEILFFGEARKVRKEFCTKGSALREDYKKHAPCMNEAQKKFQRACLTDLQVGFEAIHKSNMLQRIPVGCCNLNRFEECIFSNLEEKCGNDSVEFLQSILDRVISRLPRTFCQDFDPDSSRCIQILPASGTQPYIGRNTSSISRLLSSYTRSTPVFEG